MALAVAGLVGLAAVVLVAALPVLAAAVERAPLTGVEIAQARAAGAAVVALATAAAVGAFAWLTPPVGLGPGT